MGEEGIFQIYLVNKRKGTNEWVGTVRLEGHRHRSSSRKRGTWNYKKKDSTVCRLICQWHARDWLPDLWLPD